MQTFSNEFVNKNLSHLISNLKSIFSISIPKIAIPQNPYHSGGTENRGNSQNRGQNLNDQSDH